MKQLYLFGLLFFLPFSGFSQKEFNNWYFGNHAGVSFNTGSPVPFLTNGMDPTIAGSSNISDSLGNILFYTDGWTVYNRNNVPMPNGWINGASYKMNDEKDNIAFQHLEDLTKYFVFCSGQPTGFPVGHGLRYATVDMSLDGGLGDIPPGMEGTYVPSAKKAYGCVTATRHHNNKDVWVVVRLTDTDSNYYASYRVTAAGVNTTPVFGNSHLQLYTYPGSSVPIFNIKISRDGTRMAAVYDTVVEFCSFNSVTGQAMPLLLVSFPHCGSSHLRPNSAEFSLDSKYLYISAGGGEGCPTRYFLYQFDATLSDSVQFMNSRVLISNENRGHSLQFAPDGKIYCSVNYHVGGTDIFPDSLCVINNPSTGGIGCNYQQNVVSLQGRGGGFTLPDYVERYYAIVYDTGQCLHTLVNFSSAIWPPADSIHWDFGDPASGPSNFSLLPNPSHTYPGTGQYIAELFTRHIDKRTDTIWKVVNILLKPNIGPDRTICIGDSVTFDAGACPGATYAWKDLGSGVIVGNSRLFKTGLAGTYEVTITNPDKCDAKDTVQLMTTPVPTVMNNPLSKSICSGESTNIVLLPSVPGTMFHWTASLVSGNITGFSADSGFVINQILTNILPTPGVVNYHITPKFANCTGSPVDFPVTINQGDSVKVSITSSTNNVCAGTSVTFTAFPTFPGANPVYQWKVNGFNSGTNSDTFNYSPLNGDVVTCKLTSSNIICTYNNPATSNPIVMVVNPVLAVKDSIAASQNPVCAGTMVTFTSFPTNGGIPSYQWKVNGINVGPNSSVYSFVPNNGDLVSCVLNSSIPCPTGNPATSNTITMIVNSNLLAGVSISATPNPFCPGTSVTFTATPSNGGAPTYQWKVNGINVGINSNTYTYNPLNGDSVRCIMTSSLGCVTGNPASSNKIIMNGNLAPVVTFTSCFDTITTTNAKPIKLKGGIPLGGTYSGAGVSAGYYYPNIAGPGTHVITYSYTNVSLCTASKNSQIHQFTSSPVNCGSPITDIRDNKIYQTLQIGAQCWMATNLNFGTTIASAQDQRDNCVSEKYCYNDNPLNCTAQGGLYQWDEVMQFDETPAGQGFCPPAWHIPTENEWNTLFANWTNSGFAGSPLKYSGYSGFNALLSGARHINKAWDFKGFATFFWSSTPRSDNKAWAHGLNDPDPSVSIYPASRVSAFSVRCLKD